jgi:NTE family protein
MQQERKAPKYKIGLALSGGGYRAAAFHLGTMRKLNQLGLLDKVEVFSTVSGGSITGADYLLQLNENKDYKTFEAEHIKKLKQSVIGQVFRSWTFIKIAIVVLFWLAAIVYFQFTCCYWLSIPILIAGVYFVISNQFSIFPASVIIEGVYAHIFFSKKTLSDLPEKPLIAINSTNLETGKQFTFSKNWMSDTTYEYPKKGESAVNFKPVIFLPEKFPIARSVMASSCVPFAFTPVQITADYFKNPADTSRAKPILIDGGIFDNQGIHKLTFKDNRYECETVIVSDAGDKMPFEHSHNNLVTLLYRTCDLFMNRIKKSEMTDNLYHNVVLGKKEIAYISLGWDLDQCIVGFVKNMKKGLVLPQVIQAHNIPSGFLEPFDAAKIHEHLEKTTGYEKIKQQSDGNSATARGVGTNLTALPDKEIKALINHSELMTELQVKLYCPSLIAN